MTLRPQRTGGGGNTGPDAPTVKYNVPAMHQKTIPLIQTAELFTVHRGHMPQDSRGRRFWEPRVPICVSMPGGRQRDAQAASRTRGSEGSGAAAPAADRRRAQQFCRSRAGGSMKASVASGPFRAVTWTPEPRLTRPTESDPASRPRPAERRPFARASSAAITVRATPAREASPRALR